MQPNLAPRSQRTVHHRYRHLLGAGFAPQQSAALIALADEVGHNLKDEPAATSWRWQELARVEFVFHLARMGRVGGREDGNGRDGQRPRA